MLDTSADAAADARGKAFVTQWQPKTRHWWLMYSPSKRSLMAFYLGDCPPPASWSKPVTRRCCFSAWRRPPSSCA
jgi:hypothetical protein